MIRTILYSPFDASGSYYPDLQEAFEAEVAPNVVGASGNTRVFNVGDYDTLFATLSTYDFLRTNLAGTNNDIDWIAGPAGTGGTAISIVYVVSGNNTPLSITAASNIVTVNVATSGGGAAISTANDIIALARNVVAGLVTPVLAAGNDGTGVVTALTSTPLAVWSGTTPSLAVKLQTSVDGTTYADVPNAGFTTVTSGPAANQNLVITGLGRTCRWNLVVGGSATPLAAYSIRALDRPLS